MLRQPPRFAAVVPRFAPLVRRRSWRHAEVLLLGAILASGSRTVAGALRIAGLRRPRRCADRHRALNRAARSGRSAARTLFGLLLDPFAPRGPVVPGLDDAIERRRGGRIAAKGVHRDPVRSSKGHFVKAGGLRRLGPTLLAPVPWAGRTWAGRTWARSPRRSGSAASGDGAPRRWPTGRGNSSSWRAAGCRRGGRWR